MHGISSKGGLHRLARPREEPGHTNRGEGTGFGRDREASKREGHGVVVHTTMQAAQPRDYQWGTGGASGCVEGRGPASGGSAKMAGCAKNYSA